MFRIYKDYNIQIYHYILGHNIYLVLRDDIHYTIRLKTKTLQHRIYSHQTIFQIEILNVRIIHLNEPK